MLDGEGREVSTVVSAHRGVAVSALIALGDGANGAMHPALFASGDDDGFVRLWDLRAPTNACAELKMHDDFVADLQVSDPSQASASSAGAEGGTSTAAGLGEGLGSQGQATLLSAGGDGRLSAIELRRFCSGRGDAAKSAHSSDPQDDELLSCAVLKHGKKVVCGTQAGVLVSWSFGRWGDSSDRFPGHPESVSAMLKVDESTVLTGSSDGLIRVVSLMPNELLGVLGDHDDFPVEKMRFSTDRSVVASLSHDAVVRFWDTSCFLEDAGDDDDDVDDVGDECGTSPLAMPPGASARASAAALATARSDGSGKNKGRAAPDTGDDDDSDEDDDWEDMSDDDNENADDDEEEEEEDDDDDDDADLKPPAVPAARSTAPARAVGRGAAAASSAQQKHAFKSPRESFFSDL